MYTTLRSSNNSSDSTYTVTRIPFYGLQHSPTKMYQLHVTCVHYVYYLLRTHIPTNCDTHSKTSSGLVHFSLGTFLDTVLELLVHWHEPIRTRNRCLPAPFFKMLHIHLKATTIATVAIKQIFSTQWSRERHQLVADDGVPGHRLVCNSQYSWCTLPLLKVCLNIYGTFCTGYMLYILVIYCLCWLEYQPDISNGRALANKPKGSGFASQPGQIFAHLEKILLFWIIYQ